jgi:hypothetical protein
VYYWVVPADVSGSWKLTGNATDEGFESVNIEQKYQKFTGTVTGKSGSKRVTDGVLKGSEFTLNLEGDTADAKPLKVTGKVTGDKLEAQVEGSDDLWTAEREKRSQ